jgi:hypothetical protein
MTPSHSADRIDLVEDDRFSPAVPAPMTAASAADVDGDLPRPGLIARNERRTFIGNGRKKGAARHTRWR